MGCFRPMLAVLQVSAALRRVAAEIVGLLSLVLDRKSMIRRGK
jgi:hypothetical protein